MTPTIITWLGIVLGLSAATSQSLSYLLSRHFTTAFGSQRELLVLSSVIQGAVCLPLALLMWPNELPPMRQWILPAGAAAGFFCLAQACLFTALRHTEASRVAPMLALKTVIVAMLTVVVLGDVILPLQWGAIALAVVGAFVLNYTGGALQGRAALAIVGACLLYSVDDFSIRLMLDAMAPVPRLHAAIFGLTVVHVLLGICMLPGLGRFGSRRAGPWRAAAPFALVWLLAMVFLFGSFATAGIVLAGMAQSMRGIISIGLGAVLAAQGLVHLEQRLTRGVLWRRMIAALMMSAAVTLYAVSGSQARHSEPADTLDSVQQRASHAARTAQTPPTDSQRSAFAASIHTRCLPHQSAASDPSLGLIEAAVVVARLNTSPACSAKRHSRGVIETFAYPHSSSAGFAELQAGTSTLALRPPGENSDCRFDKPASRHRRPRPIPERR